MGRKPCCDKEEVKRGPWTVEEDRRLMTFMLTHGHCRWRAVPQLAGLRRCGKSCRLRWTNYLRPDLKRGLLSEEEEKLIIYLHSKIGNRWSRIAAQLPGRTDNEIKNHWNTRIKKKLRKMGIDPNTHNSITPIEEGKKEDEVHPLVSTNSSSVGKEDPLRVTTPPPPPPDYDPTAVEMEELDEFISNFCTGDVPLIQQHGIIGASPSMGSSVPSSASTISSNRASSSTVLEEEYSKMPPPCDPTSLDIDVSDYLRDLQTDEIPQIQANVIDDIVAPCSESADHDPLGFLDFYDMALSDDSSTLGFGCNLDLLFDNTCGMKLNF